MFTTNLEHYFQCYVTRWILQEARQKIQAMAVRGEGITERNWPDVRECLQPGNHTQEFSVTRSWIKKEHNLSQCCPKYCHCSFYLKEMFFQISPKVIKCLDYVLVIFVAHQTFKIRPIWSHYRRSDPETTLYLHSERPTIHFPTFLVRLSAALNTYSIVVFYWQITRFHILKLKYFSYCGEMYLKWGIGYWSEFLWLNSALCLMLNV